MYLGVNKWLQDKGISTNNLTHASFLADKNFIMELQERRRVRVWVEKTFRGRKLPALTEIHRTSYKPDYQLISKKEEALLLAAVKDLNVTDILPNKIEMPPLMQKFIEQEHTKKGLEVKHILINL